MWPNAGGKSTVFDYLKRAEAAGLQWPLPDYWDDERLERPLFAYGQHEPRQPPSRWHKQIGDSTLADGILDRLVHNAHRIEMRGDSMRKNRGKTKRIACLP